MSTEIGHLIFQDGTKIQIGITNYSPGRPRFTTFNTLDGVSNRVQTGYDSGSISFVVNPQFAPDTGEANIELPDGKVIEAFINNISHKYNDGQGIAFCTGLTR